MDEAALEKISLELIEIGKKAKCAADALAVASDEVKRKALENMAERIEQAIPEIINANMRDTDAAQKKGISSAMLDRLTLDEKRICQMAEGRCIRVLPQAFRAYAIGLLYIRFNLRTHAAHFLLPDNALLFLTPLSGNTPRQRPLP